MCGRVAGCAAGATTEAMMRGFPRVGAPHVSVGAGHATLPGRLVRLFTIRGHMALPCGFGRWSDGLRSTQFRRPKDSSTRNQGLSRYYCISSVGPINRPILAPIQGFSGLFLTEGSKSNFFSNLCCTLWRIPRMFGGRSIGVFCNAAHFDAPSFLASTAAFQSARPPGFRFEFWRFFGGTF